MAVVTLCCCFIILKNKNLFFKLLLSEIDLVQFVLVVSPTEVKLTLIILVLKEICSIVLNSCSANVEFGFSSLNCFYA